MNERHCELKCVVSCAKHLAFWILGFSWLAFKVTTLQTSKKNLSTAPFKIGNTISCSLCVSDTFTLWCELPKSAALKNTLMTAKVWDPIVNFINIYTQNLQQQSIKPSLYTTGIVCVNVSEFLHMWNYCWFYICICIIRYTLNMQNSTNSYDEKLQLVHHLKYLNVRTMSWCTALNLCKSDKF